MDEETDSNSFISKIGTFLLLVGGIVIVLFIASDIGDQTYFRLFFIGIILLTAGFMLKKKSPRPQEDSNRFVFIRRLNKNRLDKKNKN
ncbi:MAG: hypothetical protein WCP19_11320 [Chloroflexota bacterium]